MLKIREHVTLAPFTTLGVGGPARYFVETSTEADSVEAVQFAHAKNLPLFILGGGSNLLVADAGFPGLVLKVEIPGCSRSVESDGRVIFDAGAGVVWDELVALAVEANCAGVECLSGIPGTVGGTPVQNVGAYGQEVSSTIREVVALDLQSMQIRTLSNADCRFGYRTSIFNTTDRGRYLILRVCFILERGGGPTLHYADLQHFFARNSNKPTLAEVRSAVREIRRNKAMLIVPGDEDSRSVGSFFKNPVVPQPMFEELAGRMVSQGRSLPSYDAGNGFRKLPAGWLVEHTGFVKGYSRGPVGISRRHALAIINRGGATAAEILSFSKEIQARVMGEFGIRLDPEPVFLGF